MLKRFKNLFVPHYGNNYKPDFLERVSVGIMLILILLSFTMANLQALLWIGSDWLVSSVLPAVIVDLTNDERDTGNLSPLTRSEVLDTAAKMKAKDMAEKEYFAHYSPDGVSPWHWFDEARYDYLHAGENLAVHFTESSEVVDAWMKSPAHRENIMNGQYDEIGVGTAKGEYKGQPTIYVVQLFGKQRAPLAVTSRVAGATSNAQSDITIEKVAVTETQDDVAPATIVTEKTTTIEPEPVKVVDTVPNPIEMDTEQLALTPKQDVTVYTSLSTTSRDGEPLVASPVTEPTDTVSIPLRSATESSLWLKAVYAILTFIVVVALLMSLAFEWRRHHPLQIAYAGGLLAVMALLLYIHTTLTGTVLIV